MKRLFFVAAAAAALAIANHSALAQQKPDESSGTGTGAQKGLEEVIITGTRREDRTLAESSAPIDVIGGPNLVDQPSSNMLDTLSNLVPSFIVGQIGRASCRERGEWR